MNASFNQADACIINARDWQRPALIDGDDIRQRVAGLLADIAQRGDTAIREYSERFDGCAPEVITLQPFADYQLPTALADALQLAAARIRRFAEFQRQALQSASFEDEYGRYGQVVTPVARMGAYIPGGRFPLLSTALMTLIPAAVAGCEHRIAVSPSTHPAVLAAASLAGATTFIRIGGAQAIGMLAYGSSFTAPVDVIVGPGNAYVAEAKSQLQNRVRIDTLAGPSELLILSDGNNAVDWLLNDGRAQAEHDPQALSVYVSRSREELHSAWAALQADARDRDLLERQQIQLVFAESIADSIALANRMAPEHLQLCDSGIANSALQNYGALFCGAHSPVALGDYLSGPNHTLPTLGAARRSGGLSVLDFLRVQTVQEISKGGALYEAAAVMADAEGLIWHARSLRCRQS